MKGGRTRPTLDRDRIVTAAITQLDEDGASNLTMRKLAARLDVAPMTLYGHVSTKSDLLELALDEVFAESLARRTSSGDWRTELTDIAERTFDVLLGHPWAPPLIGGRPPLGPGATAHFGELMRILTGAGFADTRLDSAISGIYYYVLGAALAESAWNQIPTHEAQQYADAVQQADVTEFQSSRSMTDYLQRHAGGDTRSRFRAGLAGILNGLELPD